MSSVDSILDTDKFSEWIGLETVSSKNYFNKQISEWNSDPTTLMKFADV